MESFSSLRRHSTWGKSFSMLLITDLNTVPPVERSLTTAISHISSALVMYYLCKNLSFWKTHLCKLISNCTWNCLITYTKGVVVISLLVYSLTVGGWLDASRHALMWWCDAVSEFIRDALMWQHDAVSVFIWASAWLCSNAMRFQSIPTIWPLLTTESPVAQW